MKKFLMKHFALSESGAKDMIRATFKVTVNNLSLLLSFWILAIFLQDGIKFFYGGEVELKKYILMILAILIIRLATERLVYDAVYTSTYRETSKIRIALAEKLAKLPLSFFEKKDLADLSKRILSDVETLEHAYSHALPQFLGAGVSTLIICAMMALFSPAMAIATFWPVPLTFIFILGFKRVKEEAEHKHYFQARQVAAKMQELMDNVVPIKAYGRKEKSIWELEELIKKDEKLKIKSEKYNPFLLAPISGMYRLGMVSIILVGFSEFTKGNLPLYVYLQLIVASNLLYAPIEGMMTNLMEFFYIGSSVESIGEINEMKIMTGKKKNPKNYDYEIKNVSFSYEDTNPVLKNITTTIKQKEVTALVGLSGCGKSTLTKLMLRFYDVDSGEITLGGESLSDWDPEDLLKNMSMVFQDVILFNNTIYENIRIGKKNATEEEVFRAAKIAQVDEFVKKLPQGYDTKIGEGGRLLSGGERQRISIARALLKDAPIIFLDESTASVDADSETKIQDALSKLIRNKTLIVIAHRLRTVMNADKVIVMEEGRIVEEGKPMELLQRDGLFKKLYELQKGQKK